MLGTNYADSEVRTPRVSSPSTLDAGETIHKPPPMPLMKKGTSVAIARLIFQPAADKNLQREEIYRFRNCLMMEGFIMLAEQQTPRYIEARINSFLDPKHIPAKPKRSQ